MGHLDGKQSLSDDELARFTALFFDNAHDGIIIADVSGQILDVNPRYIEMTGLSREKLLKYNIKYNGSDQVEHPLWEQFLEEGFTTTELVNTTQSGRQFSRQMRITCIKGPSGDVSHVVAMISDTTSLRASKQAVAEKESHITQIVESFPQPILVINKEHVITHWNHACEVIFGVEANKMVGTKNQWKPFYSEERPVMADIVLNQDESGLLPKYYANKYKPSTMLPGAFEAVDYFPHFKPDGRWLYFTAMAIKNSEGEIIGAIESLIDITDQKNAEAEALALNEELEARVAQRTSELESAMKQLLQAEKLASLGSLVAGVAHELNTPIGNMMTLATTLQEHASEFNQAVEQGQLKRSSLMSFQHVLNESCTLFEHSATRAAELISSFKQVAVDQSSSRRRKFILSQVVTEVCATLRPMLKKTPHCVSHSIPEEIVLDSYPGPIEQIVTNLITNSITHAFDEQTSGTMSISARQEVDYVNIIYRDNGRGMTEETLNKLFDPFYTTRLGCGGSGLGMYITYNLVTAILGGTIHVKSKPDEGSCFEILIPSYAPESEDISGEAI